MEFLIGGLAIVSQVVRIIVATIVIVFAIVCLLDWLVRTRRLNAFHPISRFVRQRIDPLLAPIERQVVRAGGLPTSAPLWGLAFAIIGGIILITLVDFILNRVAQLWMVTQAGPRGIFVLLVDWTFTILKVALIIRVVVSWLPISPYSKWVRWAFTLSEPILRPLRGVVPTIGPLDITPIVAYFLLTFLQWILLSFRF
jgi:YggT family protein